MYWGENMLIKKRLLAMGNVTAQKDFLPHRLISHLVDFGQEDMEASGVYPGYLLEHNQSLVVYQWDIEFLKGEVYGKRITEKCFSKLRRNLFFMRYFGIYHEDELLVKACGRWIIMDTEKRAMTLVPKQFILKAQEEVELLEKQGNDLLDISTTPIYIEPFEGAQKRRWEILPSYIDVNGHINNRILPAFAFNSMSFDFHRQYRIKKLTVTYHKEEKEDLRIGEEYWRQGDDSYHRFLDQQGNLLASIHFLWEKR